jgi:hypothetical protein
MAATTSPSYEHDSKQAASPSTVSDSGLERAYNSNWYKEIKMEDVNPGQISNQLGQIVAQLAAIREALEKLVAQNDHPTYSQAKRY